VGYSQGAQLVHNAVKQLSAAVLKRIKALVTFVRIPFKFPFDLFVEIS
jgi:hypothetical protein